MPVDCGKPRGEIFKVAWSGVADKWPGASEAINDFHITSDEMGAMVGAVDLDGKTVDAVVAEWMASNESTWQGWIN